MTTKQHEFVVKLDKWTNPIRVTASSALEARDKALKEFPTCDCCDESTKVESVNYIEALIKI